MTELSAQHVTLSRRCDAVGALMVGGRVVGQLRCEKAAGHDERVLVGLGQVIPGGYRQPEDEWQGTARYYSATPHAMTLEWTPEAEPDLDLFDPAESFDVEVPLD
jgi:hypothetical protein